MPQQVVRLISAYYPDRVVIRWTLDDGSIYREEHTIPPPDVLAARLEEQRAQEERDSSALELLKEVQVQDSKAIDNRSGTE